MTIDIQKIYDGVEEGNCVVCGYGEMNPTELPDGSVEIHYTCSISDISECYVVVSEVERLTP